MLTFPDSPIYSGVTFHDAILYSYPAHAPHTSYLPKFLVWSLSSMSPRGQGTSRLLSAVSQAESPL